MPEPLPPIVLTSDARPGAWQVQLGYQFGWNPYVEVVGAQGTYLAIGYSESRDLAGATRLIDNLRLP